MNIQSYRDLEVWKKSIALVKDIYLLTNDFPKSELYSLSSQLRRAAISISSNIAEGRSRSSTKEFIRFIDIAYGSLAEVETQCIIANELGYINSEQLNSLILKTSEIGRMLNGLSGKLKEKLSPEPRALTSEPCL